MGTLKGIIFFILATAWVALFMSLLDNKIEFEWVLNILSFIGHIAIGYAIAIYFFRKDLWDKIFNK